jgi:hypothetical protein
MRYDILLEGRNGERLVDFASCDEAKDYKVEFYIKSFTGCARQYDITKVIARSREVNGIKEEYEII